MSIREVSTRTLPVLAKTAIALVMGLCFAGCATTRPAQYARFEQPLEFRVSDSEARTRTPDDLAVDAACRLSIATGLSMSQRPNHTIEGWLQHRTGFWSGRPREFNGRTVQLDSRKDGTDTVITLAFPWACDNATNLERDRWAWLAAASEKATTSWNSIATDTQTASADGLGHWDIPTYRAYLTRGECRIVTYEGEFEDVAFASSVDRSPF